MKFPFNKPLLLILAVAVMLAGCVLPRPQRDAPDSELTPIFIPPELHPATPTPDTLKTTGKNPEQDLNCVDGLSFLNDLTIPDGTEVKINDPIEKQWEVKNTGTCNWSENYSVRLVAGLSLGANPEQKIYPALSGSKAVLSIDFLAPLTPGNYRSAWQAYNPKDQPFGDIFYIDIVVKAP
jgi:hypothetical protein